MKRFISTMAIISILSSSIGVILTIIFANSDVNRSLFSFLSSFFISFGSVLGILNLFFMIRNPEAWKDDKHD